MHTPLCRAAQITKFVNLCCRDVDDLQQVLNINVVGTFAVTKALLPMLKKGTRKTIVNISSDAACLTLMYNMGHAKDPVDSGMALSYKASKVAVNMGEQSFPVRP